MNTISTFLRGCLRPSAVLPAALAFVLAACGGGGSTDLAGVGSGGSGVASGTVSGFGSIIVDGVEYDDSSATHQAQDADGASVNVAVKLGQRVRLVYSGAQVARSIEVQAQLLGPVTVAPGTDGVLQVMGQRVRLVTSSADPTLSSLTVLAGYADTASIHAGDEVEVHGAWAFDSTLGANVRSAVPVNRRSQLSQAAVVATLLADGDMPPPRHIKSALSCPVSRCGPWRQAEPSAPRHQGCGSKRSRRASPWPCQPPAARCNRPVTLARASPAVASAWRSNTTAG